MLFIKRFKLIDVLFQKLSGRKAWKEFLIWTIHFTPFVGNRFVCGSVSHETRETLNTIIKLLLISTKITSEGKLCKSETSYKKNRNETNFRRIFSVGTNTYNSKFPISKR